MRWQIPHCNIWCQNRYANPFIRFAYIEGIDVRNQHDASAWELMSASKAVLGMKALVRIFKIGSQQLYKQMKNPDLDGEHARPVIARVGLLVRELEEMGGGDTAHAILQFMALPAGYTCIPVRQAAPTCPTVHAECLEDYPTLVQLHEAINSGRDMRAVQTLLDKHVDEVRQTVTLYEQEQGE